MPFIKVPTQTLNTIFKDDIDSYACILASCADDTRLRNDFGDYGHYQLVCCAMRNALSNKNIHFYYNNNQFTTTYSDWRKKAIDNDVSLLVDLINFGDPTNSDAICTVRPNTCTLMEIYHLAELECDFSCDVCPV